MKYCFRAFSLAISLIAATSLNAQKVDYSVVSVPEESGIDFTCITSANDYVCMPQVKRSRNKVEWLTNRIIGVSTNGEDVAYLSARQNTTNIFIKPIGRQGSSAQRTNRQKVLDFSFSPDGKYICFSEIIGKQTQIFQTDAKSGYVCRQITSGNNDYSPIYSADMKQVFLARQEARGTSIWSYDTKSNFMSSYTAGMNPYPLGEGSLLCARPTTDGRSEIWRINYNTGVEECIVSDSRKSFSTPMLSPNGRWILMVGSSEIVAGNFSYWNTDIYVCHTDGSGLQQLTYHAADDLSPVWSRDGSYIFFISQRGSAEATANVWRMPFVTE